MSEWVRSVFVVVDVMEPLLSEPEEGAPRRECRSEDVRPGEETDVMELLGEMAGEAPWPMPPSSNPSNGVVSEYVRVPRFPFLTLGRSPTEPLSSSMRSGARPEALVPLTEANPPFWPRSDDFRPPISELVRPPSRELVRPSRPPRMLPLRPCCRLG